MTKNTQRFLIDLLNPKVTPRVPKEIRDRAYQCLKNTPTHAEYINRAYNCLVVDNITESDRD